MEIVELFNDGFGVLENKTIIKVEYKEEKLRNEFPDVSESHWSEYHYQTYCFITCNDGKIYKFFVWSTCK